MTITITLTLPISITITSIIATTITIASFRSRAESMTFLVKQVMHAGTGGNDPRAGLLGHVGRGAGFAAPRSE